jgi:hypothetical protein
VALGLVWFGFECGVVGGLLGWLLGLLSGCCLVVGWRLCLLWRFAVVFCSTKLAEDLDS